MSTDSEFIIYLDGRCSILLTRVKDISAAMFKTAGISYFTIILLNYYLSIFVMPVLPSADVNVTTYTPWGSPAVEIMPAVD